MIKKLIFASIMLSLAVPATPVSATRGNDSEKNHANYWGNNCVKFDNLNQTTWSATRGDVIKVIVKGGPDRTVYTTGPFTNLTAPVNPNNKHGKNYGISHVIECFESEEFCDHEDCGEVEVCEFNQNLAAHDENCKPPVECVENCGQGGETPQPPTTPEVLGAEDVKILPKTGINSFISVAIGSMLIGTVSYLAAINRQFDI